LLVSETTIITGFDGGLNWLIGETTIIAWLNLS
jgi:hypothetical protein